MRDAVHTTTGSTARVWLLLLCVGRVLHYEQKHDTSATKCRAMKAWSQLWRHDLRSSFVVPLYLYLYLYLYSTPIVNLSGRRLHALHDISKSFHPCVSPRSTFCWPCLSARSFHCLFFPRLSSANTQYTWAMENSPMVVLDMSSSADSNTRRTGMCCILSLRNFTWGGRTDHIRRPGWREKTRQHTRFALGSSGPSSLAFGRRPAVPA